jgi:hypothetical protein
VSSCEGFSFLSAEFGGRRVMMALSGLDGEEGRGEDWLEFSSVQFSSVHSFVFLEVMRLSSWYFRFREGGKVVSRSCYG